MMNINENERKCFKLCMIKNISRTAGGKKKTDNDSLMKK